MIRAGLRGMRGGAGCTSLTAGLAYSLSLLGKSVLCVDMCASNQLRLHFNHPLQAVEGWSRRDGTDLRSACFELSSKLAILPHGGHRDADILARGPGPGLEILTAGFDWVLFDLGSSSPAPARPDLSLDIELRVLPLDVAAVMRLDRADLRADAAPLLINRYNPTRPLQRDLVTLLDGFRDLATVSQKVHEDPAFEEALASKMPVGYYASQSMACQDLTGLATWCLSRAANGSGPRG